jgi:hypothetical protein
MYIELDGITYMIRFVRVGRSTFAELMTVKKDGGLGHTDFVGESRLYHKDIYDRLTGRKHALVRLLDKIDKHHVKLSKETRQKIWELFREKYSK